MQLDRKEIKNAAIAIFLLKGKDFFSGITAGSIGVTK
tara:strand:+ start:464 stop:574 length:111 start_codon:yes stop_codon:yes gene_type:complete